MLRDLKRLMARYGTAMTLLRGDNELPVKAFLQESRSQSQENAQRAFGPLGEVPKGLFVYLGPVEPEVDAGDLLQYGYRIFEFRRAETVMVGEEKAYIWGLCVEKGGDTQWGG